MIVLLFLSPVVVFIFSCRKDGAVNTKPSNPIITSIKPLSGKPGDTVTIGGSNFNPNPAMDTVKFGGIRARVLKATIDTLSVTIPQGSGTGAVTVNGATAQGTVFTVTSGSLTITAVKPPWGKQGDTIVITGTNFNLNSSLDTVKLNDIPAKVLKAATDSLVVLVPNGNIAGVVTVNGVKAPGPAFAIVRLITVSPDTGAAHYQVVITAPGVGIDNHPYHDSVYFNGVLAMNDFVTDSEVVVFVPEGVTTGKVTLIMNGQRFISASDYKILPGTWLEKQPLEAGSIPAVKRFFGVGFAIGGLGYMGLGVDGSGVNSSSIVSYDPVTGWWSGAFSMDTAMEAAVCMVMNNKAYIGMGLNKQFGVITRSFYAFDPATNTITRKADFPGPLRYGALNLTIGNKGYVGFGFDGTNYLKDIWCYDPVSDSWTQKSDFPGVQAPYSTVGFSLDNVTGYIATVLSIFEPFQTAFWLYNPATDGWTRKNDFPGHVAEIKDGFNFVSPGNSFIYPANAMVINGNGYLMGNTDNWLYNPSADSWSQKAFVGQALSGSSFVIGGHGYYGGGDGYYINYVPFYQFTP